MKKYIKKFCYTTLFSTIILIESTTIYATNISSDSIITTEPQNTYFNSTIQDELHKMGSSVLIELKKQKFDYQYLLKETISIDEQEQLIELINTTQELIDIYENSSKFDINTSDSTFGISLLGSDLSLTNPELYAAYCNNVSTVIAYFNAKGYKLSAELLTHATKNKNTTSTYKPTYGNRVKSSSVFTNIAKNSKTKGSATFPNSGTKIEKDLYYAIHKFNYTKSSPKTKTVTITDKYDYVSSKDYTGVAGIAVNVMADAQRFGIIVPYKVLIKCTSS